MNAYNEYGGFLELESGRNGLYHPDAIYLNSARNALKYIIRLHGIKKIAVPYFTCPVIWQAIKEENCEAIFYDVNRNMDPKIDHLEAKEFILCNNYFGIKSKIIHELTKHYTNLIVDNAQAFYSPAYGLASFYSPRKFFGLPDGGIAITESRLHEVFATDVSWQRCTHLLKRHDLGANAAYQDFCAADQELNEPEIKFMSNLTKNMMSSIEYEYVKSRRRENFSLLHSHFASINRIHIDISEEDVPLAYPLVMERADIKKELIKNHIYTPTYWPNLESICPESSNALYFKSYLIPLPLDQRYNVHEINAMISIVQKVIKGEK